MPRVNVYIRNENMNKWDAIANKSAWLNALLTNSDDTSEYGKERQINKKKYVQVLKEDAPNPITYKPTNHWGA